MPASRLDNIRGSWLLLVALVCLALILGFGLGSERNTFLRSGDGSSSGRRTHDSAAFWEDLAPETDPAEEAPEEDPDALPEMAATESLRGIVRDDDGGPIAGAAVSVERWRRGRWESLATSLTDESGHFVVGPVPNAHLSVVARAEGFASERKSARTGAELEFTLRAGGTFAGQVVDALTGDPIAECVLTGWSGRRSWYERAETDEEGRFRFLSVPPGRIWLTVSPPVHRQTRLADIEIRPGEETFKEIPVVAGGRLFGKVLDRQTKLPVAGATIRTWDSSKSAVSGEDGTWEILSPPTGGISFLIEAEDYPEQWQWVQVGGDPEGEYERDLEIGRGGSVAGTVRSPDGTPVAGALVGPDPGELMTGVTDKAAVTDAEGNFVLESFPSSRGTRLFAVAADHALSRSEPFDVLPGTEMGGILITLQTGATFRGTVVDEDAEPLAGVAFSMQREWQPSDGGWFWVPGLVAYSREDGTWDLPGVPQGTYSMEVALEGYAPERRRPVNAPAAGEVAGQDFVLRKGSSITGWVRDREGQPVAGASINAWGWVTGSDGSMQWTKRDEVRSNDEGWFLLDGLRDGSYQVNVEATGFAQRTLQGVRAGSRDLQFTLPPTARLEGFVFEADGATPVPTFKINVLLEVDAAGNPQHPPRQVQSQDFADRTGAFTLQGIPEGQLALEAVSGDRVSRRVTGLLVTAGQDLPPVRLTVARAGRLRVTVLDPSGVPIEGAGVNAGHRLADGMMEGWKWAQTDAEGVAELTALTDGTWQVSANHGDKVQATALVDVGSGVEAELTLRLILGGAVMVTVTDADGRPVKDARVSFSDPLTGNQHQLNWGSIWRMARERSPDGNIDWRRAQHDAWHTDARGTLLREDLPPGPCRVRVQPPGEGVPPVDATLQVLSGYEIDHRVALPDEEAGN